MFREWIDERARIVSGALSDTNSVIRVKCFFFILFLGGSLTSLKPGFAWGIISNLNDTGIAARTRLTVVLSQAWGESKWSVYLYR